MDLEVRWSDPLSLRRARPNEPLIYACDALDRVPDAPGVYVFGRRFGQQIEPIYIGRANRLSVRIGQHLASVPLMRALEQAANGQRVLLIGEWLSKRGQQMSRCLPIIETALIKFAMAEGYNIVNQKGARTPFHALSMRGNRTVCTRLFRSSMKLEQR